MFQKGRNDSNPILKYLRYYEDDIPYHKVSCFCQYEGQSIRHPSFYESGPNHPRNHMICLSPVVAVRRDRSPARQRLASPFVFADPGREAPSGSGVRKCCPDLWSIELRCGNSPADPSCPQPERLTPLLGERQARSCGSLHPPIRVASGSSMNIGAATNLPFLSATRTRPDITRVSWWSLSAKRSASRPRNFSSFAFVAADQVFALGCFSGVPAPIAGSFPTMSKRSLAVQFRPTQDLIGPDVKT